ncbi:glycosyltransferase [Cupriavidus sp. 2TAF22]|uniref:glycosyltransferase n=1 Tax=unclassified Cupriavidus TaxID=2640874 RepID=UPI003F936365
MKPLFRNLGKPARPHTGAVATPAAAPAGSLWPGQIVFPAGAAGAGLWRRCVQQVRAIALSPGALVILAGQTRLENWTMLLASMAMQRRRAAFFHGAAFAAMPGPLGAFADAILLRHCHGVFVGTDRGCARAIAADVPPRNIFACRPPAVLPEDFDAAAELRARAEQAPSQHAPHYLHVGTLDDDAGLGLLLRAFAATRRQWPAATLSLVGTGHGYGRLRAAADTLRLGTSVRFLGTMAPPDIAVEYRKASCLVLPHACQRWHPLVREALSYGCPVVVSVNNDDAGELLRDGVTGLYFKPGDAGSLASRLAQVPVHFGDAAATGARCQAAALAHSAGDAGRAIAAGCVRIMAATG